jgi:hypothetical protein
MPVTAQQLHLHSIALLCRLSVAPSELCHVFTPSLQVTCPQNHNSRPLGHSQEALLHAVNGHVPAAAVMRTYIVTCYQSIHALSFACAMHVVGFKNLPDWVAAVALCAGFQALGHIFAAEGSLRSDHDAHLMHAAFLCSAQRNMG